LKGWHQLTLTHSSSLLSSHSQITNLCVKRLETLRTQVRKKAHFYSSKLSHLQRGTERVRSGIWEAHLAHQSQMRVREERNIAPSSPHLNADPWLEERVLHSHLDLMVKHENVYQGEMNVLFEDMALFDAHVVEEMKRVMEEYALIRNSLWASNQVRERERERELICIFFRVRVLS
jgi:hypothetical protein